MEVLEASEPRWGVAFFSNNWLEADWFMVLRTDMVRELQYDSYVQAHRADCEFYARVRAAGWKTLVAPVFVGHLHDINQPMTLPLHDWNATHSLLEEVKASSTIRDRWRETMFDYQNLLLRKLGHPQLPGT
ncbi:hypothetical protein WJX72_012221 [[Myrmecia] bisecta]